MTGLELYQPMLMICKTEMNVIIIKRRHEGANISFVLMARGGGALLADNASSGGSCHGEISEEASSLRRGRDVRMHQCFRPFARS